MGCLKIILVPLCFPSLPFYSHSREVEQPVGLSATSRVSWFLLPKALWKSDECPTAIAGSPPLFFYLLH